jgi:DedD protein
VEPALKQRLVGAGVLVALAVIFLPMLLDGSGRQTTIMLEQAVPPQPVFDQPALLPPATEAATPKPGTESAPVPEMPPVAEERPVARALPDEPVPPVAPKPAPKPVPPAPVDPQPATAKSPEPAWVVQVGSFAAEASATAQRDQLRKTGFAAFVEKATVDGKTVYRVRIGPELARERAEALRERLLREQKIEGLVVSHP